MRLTSFTLSFTDWLNIKGQRVSCGAVKDILPAIKIMIKITTIINYLVGGRVEVLHIARVW